ncbi:MAG: hypothetical protein V1656_02710 [Candidatus Jorgensenbacteria bacterium]
MPNTILRVIGTAVYGTEAFGNIRAGEQCYVPAALYPQSQTIVITIHAYRMEKGKGDSVFSLAYIGSRSRPFGFSSPHGGSYQNYQWDIRQSDLFGK